MSRYKVIFLATSSTLYVTAVRCLALLICLNGSASYSQSLLLGTAMEEIYLMPTLVLINISYIYYLLLLSFVIICHPVFSSDNLVTTPSA